MADNNNGTTVGAINLLLKIKTNIEEQVAASTEKVKAVAAKPFEEVGNKLSESLNNGFKKNIEKTTQTTVKKFENAGTKAAESFGKKFNATISKRQADLRSFEKQLEELQGEIDEKVFETRNNYKDVALDKDTLDAITEKTLSNDKAFQKMVQQEKKFAEKVRLMREKLGIDIRAYEEKTLQAKQKAAKKQAELEQREAERSRRLAEKKELAAQKAREKAMLKATKGFRTLGKNILRAMKSVFLMTAVYAAFKNLRTLLGAATSDSKKFSDSLNTVKANLLAAFTPIVSAVMPLLEALMARLARITTAITSFIAGVFGKTYSQVMAKTKRLQNKAGGSGGDSGSLAAFDQINQLSAGGDTTGGIDFSKLSSEGDSAATKLGEKFRNVFSKLKEFFAPVTKGLSAMFDGAVLGFRSFANAVGPGLAMLWQNVFLPIITWVRDSWAQAFEFIGLKFTELGGWFDANAPLISAAFEKISIKLKSIWEDLKPFLDAAKKFFGEVISHITVMLGGFAEFLLGKFTDHWKEAFRGLLKVAIGFANLAITVFEHLINSAIFAINELFNVIKQTKLGSFIEDKLNLSLSITPKSFPRIPVPEFANGAIISQPTLGLMGEYAGAYSNPEIVAPQSLMLETFMAAVEPIVASIRDLIANSSAGQIIHIHLDGTLSAFARTIKPYLDDEAKRKGVKIVVVDD